MIQVHVAAHLASDPSILLLQLNEGTIRQLNIALPNGETVLVQSDGRVFISSSRGTDVSEMHVPTF